MRGRLAREELIAFAYSAGRGASTVAVRRRHLEAKEISAL
jgi:hypothetical protein